MKWATGLKVESKQADAAFIGGLVGVGAITVLAEKPTWIKFLAGAVLLGGLALVATKAPEQ